MAGSEARAISRERVERRQPVDARSFGGRRLGFATAEEQARMAEIESWLLERARRAVRKHGSRVY
jgi:hypothetical protein